MALSLATYDVSSRSARVGFIGFGAIARQVIALLSGEHSRISCTALVRDRSRTGGSLDAEIVTTVEELLQTVLDVVVEAAGHEAVSTVVPQVLARGVPVVISSVGALADAGVLHRLMDPCASAGSTIYIPSGAVGGLDYLSALRQVPDAAVTYVSRKPIAAWRNELQARGIDPDGLTEQQVLFEGTAQEAAVLFPRNLNVAMAIALAGVGVHRTTVRVIADPHVADNTHEIIAQSSLGTAHFCFRNAPSLLNPRTSLVTAHSVVASIYEALQTVSRVAAPDRPIRRGT